MASGGSMTKAELVEEVSRVSDLTKKDSEVIVETVFQSIIDALHRGEKIELRGFGSFRLRQREPRKGRNPKTGDRVDVPPKRVPYFKPGKELKDLINRTAEVEVAGEEPHGDEGSNGRERPERDGDRLPAETPAKPHGDPLRDTLEPLGPDSESRPQS
jgi:integration host factor subunit beta